MEIKPIKPLERYQIESLKSTAKTVSALPIRMVRKSGDESAYTDGKDIFLPLESSFYSYIEKEALAVHEGGHIRFRSLIDQDLAKKILPENPKLGHIILNIAEDHRIETLIAHVYKGFWEELDDLNNRFSAEHCRNMKKNVLKITQDPIMIEPIQTLISIYGSRSFSVLDILKNKNGEFIYASHKLSKLFSEVIKAFSYIDKWLSFSSSVIAAKQICDALVIYFDEELQKDEKEGKKDKDGKGKDGKGEGKDGKGEDGKDGKGEGKDGKGKDGKDGKGEGKEKKKKSIKNCEVDSPKKSSFVQMTKDEKKQIKKLKNAFDGKNIDEIKEKLNDLIQDSKEDIDEIIKEIKENKNDGKISVPEGRNVDTAKGSLEIVEISSLEDIKSETNIENGLSIYNDVCNKYKITINKLKKYFQRFKDSSKLQRGYRSGRISGRDLIRVKTSNGKFNRAFKQANKSKGAELLILIDESGSMNGRKMILAREAVIILSEALKGTRIDTSIIGFCAYSNQFKIMEKVYKNLSESLNKSKIGSISTNNSCVQNRDGDSFRAAIQHLHNTGKKQYLIIISDGQPYHPSDRDIYSGESAFIDCKKAVVSLEKRKINTYAVSIDLGNTDYLKNIYRNDRYVCCNEYEELPSRLIQLVKRMTQNT